MDNNDYNLIYGIVDDLLKQVSKTIYKKYSDEIAISSISSCNLDATFRLLKIAYPCIDPGDISRHSHIYSAPPTRSERVVFITVVNDNEDKKMIKWKLKKRR
ncbi:uncharacterized protein LOC112689884 [Sipha flava]|uniref:Uncharacterized protein LOC112689884 n=1 Tax=Sipha flava TaxID=143950 RepID=A0A2S2QQI5_9HEMI|nr:uncharacterized protein LOC112689884 [Sipha flava]